MIGRDWRRLALAGWAASLLAARGLFAQATGTTTGDLRGEVREESGAALPGVSVSAIHGATGLTRLALTGGGGEFVIRLLPPGVYVLTAAREGMETRRIERVTVPLGAAARLDLTMRVAPVAETVTVSGETQRKEFASTGASSAVGETEIRSLPINRRDFLQFSLTTPGVTADRGPQTGAATTSGLSFNGQSPRYNNALLDGLDDNDPAVGAVRAAVSQEAVREYQVIRAPFAPEYGRAAGGVVNVATRSGGNKLAGTAFVFFRDEELSGRNPLTGTKTPYEQLQYGAALSGPILSRRLFFFAAVERLDVSDANVVTIEKESARVVRESGFEVETGVARFGRGRTSLFAKADLLPRSSQAWALRGTWSSEEDENQQPWGGLVAKSGGGEREIEDRALAVTGISLFGARASNELRAQAADRRHRLDSLDESGGPSVAILGVATFGTQVFLPQPRDSRALQIFDAVSFFGGRDSGKVGGDYVRTDLEGSLPLYFAGLYEFAALPASPPELPASLSSLEAFQAGIPFVFVQGFGDPSREVSADYFGLFAQGEWALGSWLLLRAGLRYDYEKPADPFPADSDNWAPRLSFSWAAGRRLRVRGGLGRFFAVAPIAPMFAVGVFDGAAARIQVRTIQGGPSPAEPWSLPGRRFGSESEAEAVPPTVFRRGRFESAHADLASLGVEAGLPRGFVAGLDYLRARGRAILVERNINPIVVPPAGRPDAAFSDIFLYESSGNSWYQGVTASLASGGGGPLDLSASYTFAEAEDDHGDFAVGQPQDPLNPSSERGPTVHVPRHRATLTAVFSTSGCAKDGWFRDWVLAAIADWSAGRPYNELAGFDRNHNGDPSSDRPEGVGRNRGRLPDAWNVDLRVGRRIPARGLSLELTLEVFNLLDRENVLDVNAVRYASPEREPNPEFGAATRVADPRRFQLGARLAF